MSVVNEMEVINEREGNLQWIYAKFSNIWINGLDKISKQLSNFMKTTNPIYLLLDRTQHNNMLTNDTDEWNFQLI